MLVRLPTALLLTAAVVSGCQCKLTDDLNQINDSGVIINDAGPPPPKFPLKEGDHIQFPGLGGRTVTCDGSTIPGDCQRAITAEFIIKGVELNSDNRWEVTADAVYQGADDFIPAVAIAPLILANAAPFDAVTEATPSSAEDAVFNTNVPATDELTPNGFPFFQYDPTEPSVFQEAGGAFCDRWQAVDPDANCEVQAADQKFEVFYKDEAAGGGAKLHKVRTEFHQMGFVCGWDEGLIPFQDGVTQRTQSDFQNVDTPDVAAIFASPVKIIRDGATYNCSCFSQKCQSGNGVDATCLSTDPDADPGPCE